jgi:hypothetical protein
LLIIYIKVFFFVFILDLSANTVSSGGTTAYYQIVNRFLATSYLYDAGNGKVAHGTSPTGNAYQWSKVDAGVGYYLLKNRVT